MQEQNVKAEETANKETLTNTEDTSSNEMSADEVTELKNMFGISDQKDINENVSVESRPEDNELEAQMRDILKEDEVEEPEKPENSVKTKEDTNLEVASSEKEESPETAEETEGDKGPEIEFKINGTMEKMPLSEMQEKFPKVFERLKNEVSGEKEIARRFTELDKKEKEVYNTVREMQEYVSAFSNKVKDGDIFGGIAYLAQLGNVPPHLAKEQLIAWATPEVLRRTELDPAQLDFERQSEELEYTKNLQESKAKKLAAEQAAIEAELRAAKLKSLREAHNVEESDWDAAFKALDAEVPQGQPITPTMVVEKANVLKRSRESESWVTEIAKSENLTVSDFEELKQIAAQYPQFTKKDLVDLVKEAREVKAQQEKEKITSNLENKLSHERKVVSEEVIDEKEIKELRKMFGIEE